MIHEGRSFVVERCLGRGGFGEVYLATMHSPGGLSTQVALKVLRPELDLRDDAVRRLRDEGRMLARVRHPSILRVVDLVVLEGRVSLITDYVQGQDLRDCMGQLPARALLQALARVASALDAAWNGPGDGGAPLNLVHRDVKPSNVRLGRHGEVVLLDFGIARTDNLEREARTRSDLVVGSLPYMAPERYFADGVTGASDVFGLGCVLYEGLTGRRYHPTAAIRELSRLASDPTRYARHLERALADLGPEVGGPLRELVASTLAFAPEDRPGAATLSRRLDEIAEGRTGARLEAWCRDRRWPPPSTLAGPLVGRTLAEGEPAPAGGGTPVVHSSPTTTADAGHRPVERSTEELAPRPPPSPALYTPPPARRPWLALGAVGAAGAGLAAVLLAGLVAFVAVWALWPAAEVEPPEVEVSLPVPPPVEILLPEEPRGSEAPAPPRPQVTARGAETEVVLCAGGRCYHLPAEVPAGEYEVLLGPEEAPAGALTIATGAEVVTCEPWGCAVTP